MLVDAGTFHTIFSPPVFDSWLVTVTEMWLKTKNHLVVLHCNQFHILCTFTTTPNLKIHDFLGFQMIFVLVSILRITAYANKDLRVWARDGNWQDHYWHHLSVQFLIPFSGPIYRDAHNRYAGTHERRTHHVLINMNAPLWFLPRWDETLNITLTLHCKNVLYSPSAFWVSIYLQCNISGMINKDEFIPMTSSLLLFTNQLWETWTSLEYNAKHRVAVTTRTQEVVFPSIILCTQFVQSPDRAHV